VVSGFAAVLSTPKWKLSSRVGDPQHLVEHGRLPALAPEKHHVRMPPLLPDITG
jgi:hypothetical protein